MAVAKASRSIQWRQGAHWQPDKRDIGDMVGNSDNLPSARCLRVTVFALLTKQGNNPHLLAHRLTKGQEIILLSLQQERTN